MSMLGTGAIEPLIRDTIKLIKNVIKFVGLGMRGRIARRDTAIERGWMARLPSEITTAGTRLSYEPLMQSPVWSLGG